MMLREECGQGRRVEGFKMRKIRLLNFNGTFPLVLYHVECFFTSHA